jgi:hypothetical protein
VEKEVLEMFMGNGTQHIVITRSKPIKCPGCGREVDRELFFSVDGSIQKVTDNSTVVEDLQGKMIVVSNVDIRVVEKYNQNLAARTRQGWQR